MYNNAHTTDVALDILSLEAIFLLPRVCSLLSLIPFFGTLVRHEPLGFNIAKADFEYRYRVLKKWYTPMVWGAFPGS